MSHQRDGVYIAPSCQSSNLTACGHGLPSNFCCPNNRVCMRLAAGTTALCCPEGASCEAIVPITCNIQLQNATLSPEGPIFTTALGATLPRCGDDGTGGGLCCPFGYECQKSGGRSHCVLSKDQTKYASLVSTSASTQPTTISIAVSSFTDPPTYPTPAPTASFNTSTIPTPPGDGVNKGVVAGSAAAASLSVIGLFAFAWVKRGRLKRTFRPKQSSPWIVHQTHFPSTTPKLPQSVATKVSHDIGAHKWETELKASKLEPELKVPTQTVYLDRSVVAEPERERNIPVYPPFSETFSPVELPATPLPYTAWQNQAGSRATRISRPRQTAVPLSRFSFSPITRSEDPDGFF